VTDRDFAAYCHEANNPHSSTRAVEVFCEIVQLVRSGRVVDAERLGDPNVPLSDV
jgi:hypothetical protein